MTISPKSRQHRWQIARKKKGKCVECGRNRSPRSANYCEPHRLSRNAQRRASYQAVRNELAMLRRRVNGKVDST